MPDVISFHKSKLQCIQSKPAVGDFAGTILAVRLVQTLHPTVPYMAQNHLVSIKYAQSSHFMFLHTNYL